MREVRVIGTGMIPFGRYPDSTMAGLGAPTIMEAIAEAGVDAADIEIAYCGTVFGGVMTGQKVLKPLGMTGMPIVNIENACSSSAAAFREAWMAVASGAVDVALAFGVEKLTNLGSGPLPIDQEDWEAGLGLTMPALYAMRARRYLYEHGLDRSVLSAVAVKARKHGALNELAQERKAITLEEAMASRPIADPLRRADCCPTGDGAACVVLVSGARARQLGRRGALIRSSTLVSGKYKTGFRDFTEPEVSQRGARIAYERAGLGPEDVNVVETHDAFTIAELLYYEALGLCGRGEAPRLLADGVTSLGGRVPVNPSGGLLAKGHPVGASGVAQIVEITRQLEGRCANRQVEGARIGLAHITGGGISGLDHGSCAVHILEH